MDMIPYRLEQVEKRYDAMDARMGRVEERLGEIQVTIAGLATKESVEALKDSLMRSMTELKDSVAINMGANKQDMALTKDSIEKSFEEFKNSVRNWGIGLAAIIITAILGVGALMTQASNNQLAAFEAGLSAIQGVAAAHSLPAAPAPK